MIWDAKVWLTILSQAIYTVVHFITGSNPLFSRVGDALLSGKKIRIARRHSVPLEKRLIKYFLVLSASYSGDSVSNKSLSVLFQVCSDTFINSFAESVPVKVDVISSGLFLLGFCAIALQTWVFILNYILPKIFPRKNYSIWRSFNKITKTENFKINYLSFLKN